MYACMYVCMYLCMYACMHVCMHACMYVCMHACTHVCMQVCMYACMVCMYVCMYVCTCKDTEQTKHTTHTVQERTSGQGAVAFYGGSDKGRSEGHGKRQASAVQEGQMASVAPAPSPRGSHAADTASLALPRNARGLFTVLSGSSLHHLYSTRLCLLSVCARAHLPACAHADACVWLRVGTFVDATRTHARTHARVHACTQVRTHG